MTAETAVDVLWKVQSRDIVKDSFGKWVANRYFKIDVTIGNNSGYALQISNVGFTLGATDPNSQKYVQSDFLPTVRGTVEKNQVVGLRNVALRVLTAVGSVATAALPFFSPSATGGQRQFERWLAAYTAGNNGLAFAYPDTTTRYLAKLAAPSLLDNGIVVQHNEQSQFIVFLDKGVLSQTADYRNLDKSPDKAKEALGKIMIEGYAVTYSRRIRIGGSGSNQESGSQ